MQITRHFCKSLLALNLWTIIIIGGGLGQNVSENNGNKYSKVLQSIDSLQQAGATDALAELHFELGDMYLVDQAADQAAIHFDQAIAFAREATHTDILYHSLNSRAILYNQEQNFDAALELLMQCKSIAEYQQDTSLLINSLNQLATNNLSHGKAEPASKYFEELLKIKRAQGNEIELISDLHNVGGMFLGRGELDKAQEYLIGALNLAQKREDTLMMAGVFTDIGELFLLQNNWEKSRDYSQQGLEVSSSLGFHRQMAVNMKHLGQSFAGEQNSDAALDWYQKALTHNLEVVNDSTEAAQVQILIANLLQKTQDYQQALPYLQQALQSRIKFQNLQEVLETRLDIADIYLKQGRLSAALQQLKICEKLSLELKNKSGKQRCFRLLAQLYEQLGNYPKAYAYQQRSSLVKDSLFNERSAEVINELEAKYQAEQQERKNAQLAAELANNELEIRDNEELISKKTQQNYVLFGSLITVLFILGFLFYVYLKRQESNRQQMLILQKEQEANNLRAMVEGEENERRRIAQDLHDGMGSLLASVKMMFDSVQQQLPGIKEVGNYQKAGNLLDRACEEVREISHNLMPGTLTRYGLDSALKERCNIIQNANDIDITYITHGLEQSLAKEIEVPIFRIVQELLTNIVKHAEATEALVQLNCEDNHLYITVEDNGKGISRDSQQNGIGLTNIYSRVKFLQGELNLDSAPLQGTAIHIEIPITQSVSTND